MTSRKKKPSREVYGAKEGSPVRGYRQIIHDSNDPGYSNRILVATPTTGNIRMEWALSRWGQIIPVNWGQVQMVQMMNTFVPINYVVADAQNIIVKEAIEKDFEWLLLVEHDTMLPPDAFLRFNKYIRDAKVPIVSGLYFTKSSPSEPLVFRGRGTSFYPDFKIGDDVWVDGVPTGCLLIHMGILRAMWNDPETEVYSAGGTMVKRVFNTPRKMWFSPDADEFNMMVGTSDLEWCTKIMEGGYFEKAGWGDYQKKKYPFLVDTRIFCRHIDENGVKYPTSEEVAPFQRKNGHTASKSTRSNKSK